MKHLRIVATLLAVVVVFTGLVFVVESIARPQINARLAREANEAKFAVLPILEEAFDPSHNVPETTDDYTLDDTTILSVFEEDGYGYIYEAEFQGYQSKIKYMVGVSADGEITGFTVLSQGDTPGLGAEIANPDNWEQFEGMAFNTALSGEIDGLSGATVTTDGWKASLSKVIDFHLNTVLGFTYVDITETVAIDGVTKAEEVWKDGAVVNVNYSFDFENQYSSGPNGIYVSFEIGTGVKSLQVTAATDTPEYGGKITDPAFAEQFVNMSMDTAAAGDYDGVAGASFTTSSFQGVFDKIVAYHNVNYEGAASETEAEKLARWKTEITSKGTFTDVTADYDLTESSITMIEEVTLDGETEPSYAVVTVTYHGFASDITYILGIDYGTSRFTEMRVLSQNETDGLGARIIEEEFLSQFAGLTLDGARYGVYDIISGATVTSGANLTNTFKDVVNWYEMNILGMVPEEPSDGEIFLGYVEDMYPEAEYISDLTGEYPLHDDIIRFGTARDSEGNLLGYVYLAEVVGASYSGPTTIKMLISVDENKLFNGFEVLESNDTPGIIDNYFAEEFAEEFIGEDIETLPYNFVDATAGATVSYNAIMTGVETVARYHVGEVLGQEFNRPDPMVVSNHAVFLAPAFPTADHFESVYLDTPYNAYIGNLFAAYDASNNLLGHVYVFGAPGNGGTMFFSLGVALDGTTQELAVLVENETWEQAPAYTGGESFPTSNYISLFEGVDISYFITNDAAIDDYAGVTKTTDGVELVITIVAQYHEDYVGGGN